MNDAFNDWLDGHLKKRGWTRAELARRARISQAALTLIKQNKRAPGLDTIDGICQALDVSVVEGLRAAGRLRSVTEEEARLEGWVDLFYQLTPEQVEKLTRFGFIEIGWDDAQLKKAKK